MKAAALVVPLLALVGLAPVPAHADEGPPEDYVETCTLERQQQDGLECRSCRADHSEREACSKELAPQGFTQRCRSYGASVWTEVWCKGEARAPVSPTGTPSKSSCAGARPESALAAVGLALAVLAVARRLRRVRG